MSKQLLNTISRSIISMSVAMIFTQTALAENTTVDQQFAEGMNLRDAGDYEASIAAFQGVLSSEPTLNRARAELAVSYFRALNFAAAKEEAEKVLADPNTPEGVKVNVRKFLETIDNESRKHVFTPYVTFGFGHDNNVNVGPSSSTINLGGAQLVANATPISKNYNMLNVGLAHRYLSPTPIHAFGRSAAYIWQSNVSYYRNDYFGSSDYDLNVLSLSTGPLAVVAERWRAGVDFTYDYINLGHAKLAEFYGVTPSATWSVNKTTDVSLNAKYQNRQFNESAAPGRDSNYESVELNVGKAFFDSKFTVQVGANLFNEKADVSRFSNDGYQLSAGANMRIAESNNVYVKNVYKSSKFDGVEPLFNVARDENENRITIGVNHRFSQNIVKDWTVDANVTHTNNNSNVAIYDYSRTQFGVTMGKFF